MGIKGYILFLQKFDNWDKNLGPITTEVLAQFTRTAELSAYQVCKNLENHTSYKNVHKKVKFLLSLGLIQESKKGWKHGAIYYNLSPYGVFYLFFKDIAVPRYLGDLLETYANDNLFRELLYPYFQKTTLRQLESIYFALVIRSYLHECCKGIMSRLNYIRGVAELNSFRYPVLIWNDVIHAETNKKLLRYLKNRFDLEWINIPDTTVSKKNNDRTIEIKCANNSAYISLNEDISSAKLIENNRILYEYDASYSGSNPGIIRIIDPQYQIPESTASQQLEHIKMDLSKEIGKLVVAIVTKYKWFMNEWKRDSDEVKKQDLKILGLDEKFTRVFDETILNLRECRNAFRSFS